MIWSPTCTQRWLVPALALLAGIQACADPEGDTRAIAADVAVTGGGVTVDVVTTNVWSTGFNGAVRVTNNAFPSPITSFEIVIRLGGSASISGTPWNGNIGAADASGNRTVTSPSWLPSNPIQTGQSWDVGFPGAGVFAGATIVSVKINNQVIPINGGGGDDPIPPNVSLAASGTSFTAPGTLTLTATATDNVGVVRVEFFDGTTLLTSDPTPPYAMSISLTAANNGTHSYTARATDAAGNTKTSTAVTVTVNIPTGGGGGGGYTTAGGKLLKDGAQIKLFGLNWFGLETPNHVLHGLWTGRAMADFLADIKSKGFNALRFPVSPETINPGFAITGGPGNGDDFPALNGKDGRTALEFALGKAQAAGMFVLIDFHTCNPAQLGAGLPDGPISCAGYSLDRWLADLRTLATLSTTFTNIVGLDLDNEPHGLTWATWSNLASQGGQAVLGVNPNITIWVEGVGNASASSGFGVNWGENLFEANATIPGIPANRLVFSPHIYGPSVAPQSYFSASNYPSNMPGIWDTLFGHLTAQGFTVITGEFGGRYTTSSTPAQNDKLWEDSLVTYLINKGTTSTFYWVLNPNSGDTGGVLGDDWRTWNNDKLLLLQRLMH